MNRSDVNSSSKSPVYYWAECDGDEGPSAGLIILLTNLSLEFLLGFPSNAWLVRHILSQRSKVSGVLPADFFPLSLALIQLAFSLVLPLFFANHFLLRSQDVLLALSLQDTVILVEKPLLLCLVCVERYLAVVRPVDYLRLKAARYKWGCLVAVSLLNGMLALFSLQNPNIIVCSVFLPCLAMDTFCSLSILKTLRSPPPGDREMRGGTKGEREGREEGEREKDEDEHGKGKSHKRENGRRRRGEGEMNAMKRKAFITVVVIQAVLMLNYLPFIVTLPMNGRVPPHTLKCQYMALGVAAALSCGFLQPLLYLHRLGRLPCLSL